jgi:Mg2+/Co2+ transporter CorB
MWYEKMFHEMYVCMWKHSNDSLLIQIKFCWEDLIQLWEKEFDRAVQDMLHKRKEYCQMSQQNKLKELNFIQIVTWIFYCFSDCLAFI